MRSSNWMDDYYKNRNTITDLSWIGTTTEGGGRESNYICEFCNVPLIEKLDDIAHLGRSYNRWICSKCGTVVDPKYNPEEVKHAETLHTLTDDSGNNSTEAYVEVLTVDDEIKTGRKHDILGDVDANELSDLRYGSGLIVGKFSSITRSSVNGRTVVRDMEETEEYYQ